MENPQFARGAKDASLCQRYALGLNPFEIDTNLTTVRNYDEAEDATV